MTKQQKPEKQQDQSQQTKRTNLLSRSRDISTPIKDQTQSDDKHGAESARGEGKSGRDDDVVDQVDKGASSHTGTAENDIAYTDPEMILPDKTKWSMSDTTQLTSFRSSFKQSFSKFSRGTRTTDFGDS